VVTFLATSFFKLRPLISIARHRFEVRVKVEELFIEGVQQIVKVGSNQSSLSRPFELLVG
jgi:hypothetical protein